MSQREIISRRRFLKVVASTAPVLSSALAFGQRKTSANDRVNLGFIGIGRKGKGLLGSFVGFGDVQIVAVSDVVRERKDDGRQFVEKRYSEKKVKGSYKGCAAYADFRELLARNDIDAVVIATPDHWHAIPAVMAANGKKDIYCEKPLTRTIGEGRAVVDAVARNNVVFQTGSQQRSEFGGRFRKAVELIRNGYIGEVKTIHIGVGAPNIPCDLPAEDVPEGTNWDMWVGPSVFRPYNEILCPKGIHKHFPAWRMYREFAGGGLADMGAHHFDIAQWALGMDDSGPVKIEPPAKGENVGLKLTYANGVEMLHGGPGGCSFEGTEGKIYVNRPVLETTPTSLATKEVGDGEFHVSPSNNHQRNWLDAVRSRKQPIATAEIGHRTGTVCHLTNLGYQLQRPLQWDPDQEQFADDDEANSLINQPMRAPWTL